MRVRSLPLLSPVEPFAGGKDREDGSHDPEARLYEPSSVLRLWVEDLKRSDWEKFVPPPESPVSPLWGDRDKLVKKPLPMAYQIDYVLQGLVRRFCELSPMTHSVNRLRWSRNKMPGPIASPSAWMSMRSSEHSKRRR